MAVMRGSIQGRRLGMSSTGGLVSGFDSTGGQSTAIEMLYQQWGSPMQETVTANGGTISNSGITFISTASTNGASYLVSAPVIGVHKEIHIISSATDLNLGTTATTIFFATTAATGIGSGTTLLNLVQAGGVTGVIVLRGLSTTLWSQVSHSCPSSS